jgi:hypothetical protein
MIIKLKEIGEKRKAKLDEFKGMRHQEEVADSYGPEQSQDLDEEDTYDLKQGIEIEVNS